MGPGAGGQQKTRNKGRAGEVKLPKMNVVKSIIEGEKEQ